MGSVVALAEPRTIKISSKRQITIPAPLYEELGFKDYALCTWTEDGLLIQPVPVEDEDVSVSLLRHLISEGYEGDELLEQYKKMQKKIVPVSQLIKEAEEDIAAGRVDTYENMRERIREKHGF